MLYTRGVMIQMLGVEGVRRAQERFGKGKVMTGEQVRWGLENLALDQKKLDALGFAGVMRPISTSCADHMGSTWARIQTWDGSKWSVHAPTGMQADEQIIKPMVKTAADKYAAEKKLTRRHGDCQTDQHALTPKGPAPPSRREASEAGRSDPSAASRRSGAAVAPLLDVNGIEVIYNHVILVLKGVSLQVPEGRIVALMGGNGAGKTTTLRAVSNLLARRARRGDEGLDRAARRAHRNAQHLRRWSSAAWSR